MEWKEILAWSVIGALVITILGLIINAIGILGFLKALGIIAAFGLICWSVIFLVGKYGDDEDDYPYGW